MFPICLECDFACFSFSSQCISRDAGVSSLLASHKPGVTSWTLGKAGLMCEWQIPNNICAMFGEPCILIARSLIYPSERAKPEDMWDIRFSLILIVTSLRSLHQLYVNSMGAALWALHSEFLVLLSCDNGLYYKWNWFNIITLFHCFFRSAWSCHCPSLTSAGWYKKFQFMTHIHFGHICSKGRWLIECSRPNFWVIKHGTNIVRGMAALAPDCNASGTVGVTGVQKGKKGSQHVNKPMLRHISYIQKKGGESKLTTPGLIEVVVLGTGAAGTPRAVFVDMTFFR